MPGWLIIAGLVGAAATVVLFALIARRAQSDVSRIVASLPVIDSVTTVIGGASNRRIYVSWPMARMDITAEYLLIRPRWRFVPLLPVVLRRIEGTNLRTTRRTFGDHVQFNIGSRPVTFDAYGSQHVRERLAAAGWPIEK